MMEVNLIPFEKMVNFCINNNIDLIYASSAGFYGNGNIPMKEDQELEPINLYGESKIKMDEIVKNLNFETKIVGLRYFNVFGNREQNKGESASMIYKIYNQTVSGSPRLFKYGNQKRDFVYIKDVLKANLLAMKNKKNGIFNVGTGKATTFNNLIEIINNILGKNLKPEYFDNPYSFYQNNTLADLTLIKNELGYEPDYTIEEGIKEYVKILQS